MDRCNNGSLNDHDYITVNYEHSSSGHSLRLRRDVY